MRVRRGRRQGRNFVSEAEAREGFEDEESDEEGYEDYFEICCGGGRESRSFKKYKLEGAKTEK